MIGVPIAADIAALLWFLANLGNLRIALHMTKKAVNVNPAKALSHFNMTLWTEVLVAEKQDSIVTECLPHGCQRCITNITVKIDTADIRPHTIGRSYVQLAHCASPLLVYLLVPSLIFQAAPKQALSKLSVRPKRFA